MKITRGRRGLKNKEKYPQDIPNEMTLSGKASVTKVMSTTHDDLVPSGCHDPHKTPQKTRSPSSKDMFVSLPKDLTQDVPLGV